MRALLIPTAVIAFDQFFKFLATKNLLPWVGDFFKTISCNEGIAFGIELPSLIFAFFWVVSILCVLYLIILEKNTASLLLVVGGAFSNVLDRFLHGCVIDYLSFLNIPTFNFADVAICLGVGWFVFNSFFKKDTGVKK